MTNIIEVWRKQLDEKITLIEYQEQPQLLSCNIQYIDEELDQNFVFGSWGCDREIITVEDCVLCCQVMLGHDANVSISSFASNLEYARNVLEDEEFQEDYITPTRHL